MASVAPRTAAPTAGARLQQTRSSRAIAPPLAAQRAPAGLATAAARRLGRPLAQLQHRGSEQRPRRARAVQPTASALSAGGGARAGGGPPPRRALIPPALLARLSVTLLLVGLARLGHFIPLPGTLSKVAVDAMKTSAVHQLMGPTEVVANVFLLSIAPLMSAHFFLAVLGAIPSIRKHFTALREEGTRGRDTFNFYATALFLVFSLWEAFSLARGWLALLAAKAAEGAQSAAASAPAGADAAAAAASTAGAAAVQVAAAGGSGGWGFVLQTVLILVAGSTICKWISQAVEQHGMSDGASVLIATGVAINYVHFLGDAALVLGRLAPPLHALLLVAAMCTGLTAAALWMQSVQLWVPLTFYRSIADPATGPQHPVEQLLEQPPRQGWRQQSLRPGPEAPVLAVGEGGARGHRFPLRLSPSGARSLLFANFWTALLSAPLSWLGLGNPFESALGFALLVLAVEGLSFADVTPRQMSQFLQASDAGIPNLSPGEPTQRYFAQVRQQLKLLNAALLAALSLAARGVDAASAALIGVPAGCLSLLLLASTAALGTRQVEALCRAPEIDELAERERAPVAGAGSGTQFPGPEAWW